MRYLFYPGCSQEGTALEYRDSTLAVLKALDADVRELEDWTCCGASVAPVISDLLGLVLPARNLALAEYQADSRDLLTVCSACYTNFRRTIVALAVDPKLHEKVNRALEVENLNYRGAIRVRHILDVLANDFGPEAIRARVRRPLENLTVAPYYGCQTVRPYSPYDDPQRPTSMLPVLEALGVKIHRHFRESSCCGTSLLMTKPEVGLEMVSEVLAACEGADCIVTVCPMCHMNLDAYQDKVSKLLGRKIRIPVLYLTQLLGLAFGLSEKELGLYRHITPVKLAIGSAKAGR